MPSAPWLVTTTTDLDVDGTQVMRREPIQNERPIERTQRFERAQVFRELPAAASLAPPAELPPTRHALGSIAPVASDIHQDAAHGFESMRPFASSARATNRSASLIATVLGGSYAFVAAAAVAAFVFASGASDAPAMTVARVQHEPQPGARTAIIESPESTPSKLDPSTKKKKKKEPGFLESMAPPETPLPDAAQPAPPRERTASAASAPASASSPSASAASTPASASSPIASPATAPASASSPTPPTATPPATSPTTGVIQVSGAVLTVMVDGDYRRVQNGRIIVTCGRHKVNAGRGTQVVDVPCGGTATAQ